MQEILLHILKYIIGVSIFGLIVNSIKMFLDGRDTKKGLAISQKDIEELKSQRAADLIEYNTTRALAISFEQKLDNKMKDVAHEFSEQRHQDTLLFTNALNQMEITLTEVNSTLKHLGRDVDHLRKKADV